MILIFDYFETIVLSSTHDFNRALKVFWGKYYQDRCSFEEIKALGEELFTELMTLHRQGIEFPFVKEELPRYAERFGGETVPMDKEEEADFLMEANGMSVAPGLAEMLEKFKAEGIPMYVLSNSGFTASGSGSTFRRFGPAPSTAAQSRTGGSSSRRSGRHFRSIPGKDGKTSYLSEISMRPMLSERFKRGSKQLGSTGRERATRRIPQRTLSRRQASWQTFC